MKQNITLGRNDDDATPVLDARQIPPAVRHAAIFGALDSIRPGGTLVLIAPHEPTPLLAQIDDRFEGAFEHATKEISEGEWQVRLTRAG